MAYPPSQDLRPIDIKYTHLDAMHQSVRSYRQTQQDQSALNHQRLKEIETLFEDRQRWMKRISCLFLPCTFPVKKLCCEPCGSPCSEPTETNADLCWHACDPDLCFNLDLEHSREAEGLPSAKEVCLKPDERQELESLYDNCRDIKINRQWAQLQKDQQTLTKHRAGQF